MLFVQPNPKPQTYHNQHNLYTQMPWNHMQYPGRPQCTHDDLF